MRLFSINVRCYRVHREVKVELDPSRTLIGGPNECGKSTLIEAAHRALFLRAKTTGEAQKSMISRNHGGQPEVEVCFEARGRAYRLLKRFTGMNGTATLTELDGATWVGDEAETLLAQLLGVDVTGGGRGAGDRAAQQWAHLWVWQGRVGDDGHPELRARHRLDRSELAPGGDRQRLIGRGDETRLVRSGGRPWARRHHRRSCLLSVARQAARSVSEMALARVYAFPGAVTAVTRTPSFSSVKRAAISASSINCRK